MRLAVKKTYKLFINGKFPRTESEHYYQVRAGDKKGDPLLANVCKGSRKDVRNAVVAARGAVAKWSGLTALNRGQILYRTAEMIEARAAELTAELVDMGQTPRKAKAEVEAVIEAFVHYAGWTDKVAPLLGTVNPVAGPYYNFSVPEPMGVIGVVAPEEPPLLGLVEQILPALVMGNTVVALTSERYPLAALTLGEILQNGDVPAGVVNLISGPKDQLAVGLASHMDVNAVDLLGFTNNEARAEAEQVAAENVKRVVHGNVSAKDAPERTADPVDAIGNFVEIKTVWHPMAF